MTYSSYAVANAFIQRSLDDQMPNLTSMKLQKLMFFAQSWHLHVLGGIPLFDDFFARWETGPVIPSLFHKLKPCGGATLPSMISFHNYNADGDSVETITPTIPSSDTESWALVDRVIEVYGALSGSQLATMLIVDDSVWAKSGGVDGGVIENKFLAGIGKVANKPL